MILSNLNDLEYTYIVNEIAELHTWHVCGDCCSVEAAAAHDS